MRITIDLDTQSAIDFFRTLLKAYWHLRLLPDLVRKTRKGFHIIYRDLPVSRNTVFCFRKILGDDTNRIRLDKASKKRIEQVLFYKKKVKFT